VLWLLSASGRSCGRPGRLVLFMYTAECVRSALEHDARAMARRVSENEAIPPFRRLSLTGCPLQDPRRRRDHSRPSPRHPRLHDPAPATSAVIAAVGLLDQPGRRLCIGERRVGREEAAGGGDGPAQDAPPEEASFS
jgi:hypothetical protein